MSDSHDPRQNHLLATLPIDEYTRLAPHLDTEAAGNLQRADLIEYRRGHITVIDRLGLEGRACECYAVVKKEFDRLLPDVNVL